MSNRTAFREDAVTMTTEQMWAKMAFQNAVTGPKPNEDVPARPTPGSPEEERMDPDTAALRRKSGQYQRRQDRIDGNDDPDDPESETARNRAANNVNAQMRAASSFLTLENGLKLTMPQVMEHFDSIEDEVAKKKEENLKAPMTHKLAIGADGMPIRTDEELAEWMKTQPMVYRSDYWVSMETLGIDADGNMIDRRAAYSTQLANEDLTEIEQRVVQAREGLANGTITLDKLGETDPDIKALLEQSAGGELVLNDPSTYNPEGYVVPDPSMIMLQDVTFSQDGMPVVAGSVNTVTPDVTYDPSAQEFMPQPEQEGPLTGPRVEQPAAVQKFPVLAPNF